MPNDIIWRAIKRAQIHAHKEPTGLIIHGCGATLIPWSKGKPLTWDVIVPDTFADSHINMTSSEVGAAARQADSTKNTKYIDLYSYLLPHSYRNRRLMGRAGFRRWSNRSVEELRKPRKTRRRRCISLKVYQWPFRGIMRCHSSTPSTNTTSWNPPQSTIFPLSNNF